MKAGSGNETIVLARLSFCKTMGHAYHNKAGFICLRFVTTGSHSFFNGQFTLRNAGIGSGSNPAFYTLKNEWLPVVTKFYTTKGEGIGAGVTRTRIRLALISDDD